MKRSMTEEPDMDDNLPLPPRKRPLVAADIDDATASKRLATETLTSASSFASSLSSSAATSYPSSHSIELRIALQTSTCDDDEDRYEQYLERRRRALHRKEMKEARKRRDKQDKKPPTLHPHIVLPSRCTGTLYDIIMTMPDSLFTLTHLTMATLPNGESTADHVITLCQSNSLDSQQAFDAAVAALPLNTPLSFKGRVAGNGRLLGVLDDLCLTFIATLQEADEETIKQFRQKKRRGVAGVANVPRRAQLDNASVHLTTSYRLLPDLVIPLRADLGVDDERLKEAARRMNRYKDHRGEREVVFDMVVDAKHPLHSTPLHPPDVLNDQQQRLDGRESQELSHFLTLFPTLYLSSARLVIAYLSGWSSIASQSHSGSSQYARDFYPVSLEIEVRAASDSVMQLRGFHIEQPRLRFALHSGTGLHPAILGRVKAAYSIDASATEVECSAEIALVDYRVHSKGRTVTIHVKGDCLSVMRMGDVFAANIDRPLPVPSQPSHATTAFDTSTQHTTPRSLSSLTHLTHTLDSTLSRQLPHLVPSDPPPTPDSITKKRNKAEAFHKEWNHVSCSYNLDTHVIDNVKYTALTLHLIDFTSPSSPTPSLTVLLDTDLSRGRKDRFVRFKLRPLLHFRFEKPTYGTFPTTTTISLMSFAQLARLINLPTDPVPVALLNRVQFCDVSAQLIVSTATGVASFIAGTASCGPSKRDELLFFNRLGNTANPTSVEGVGYRPTGDSKALLQTPVNRWLRLQCRAVLDSAVFPQLATLTAGRCLEPLYQYVLCDTEGGVTLTDKERRAFEQSHRNIADYEEHHLLYPVRAEPTNAVFALQPHLSSGYLKLPSTALTLYASSNHHPATSVISSFLTSSLSLSKASSLLPSTTSSTPPLSSITSAIPTDRIAQLSADMFRLCVDYLDTNSILFGLLPAIHSLPTALTTFDTAWFWRRMLMTRFGAWCDAELWSTELLSEWRSESCDEIWSRECDWLRSFVDEECPGLSSETLPAKVNFHDPSELLSNLTSDGPHKATLSPHAVDLSVLSTKLVRRMQRDVYWAAIERLQCRVNRFLICTLRQKNEKVLPQMFEQLHTTVQPLHPPASLQPDTERPTYLTAPDAAMAWLMCVPPFHCRPSVVDGLHLSLAGKCVTDDHTLDNTSPHHSDFAPFMRPAQGSHSLWSLYMGPVYAYENKHTAGKGNEVDVNELRARYTEIHRAAREDNEASGRRGVRQMYIDDVNQLPVACVTLHSFTHVDIAFYAHTLAACFRASGVYITIEQTRSKWGRIALRHASRAADESAGTHQAEEKSDDSSESDEESDSSSDEDEDESYWNESDDSESCMSSESDEEEDSDESGEDEDAMGDRADALIDYVKPIMNDLFASMALLEQELWTEDAAEMCVAAVSNVI